MDMKYQVLSPWAQIDNAPSVVKLQPRVDDLNGKTIGMYAHFKAQAPLILKEVERQIKDKFPSTKFSHYQYQKDTAEIIRDAENRPSFEKWLSGVDTVICGYGDAGSCSLFLAYNAAAIENLGKPTIMLVNKALVNPAQVGASARHVPALRLVTMDLPDISGLFSFDGVIEKYIRPKITPTVMNDIITALIKPLSQSERFLKKKVETESGIVFEGNLEEVYRHFYKKGWAYGMPIMPPTEEAVKEMLTGTDLPPDHVVAEIPPRLGKATVEKIAINAVMAGCLPTCMPALIAAVQSMMDPKIHLEGWTCSLASWSPMLIINGPIRHDLHAYSGRTVMSPYYRANATIAHAFGLIVMNIGGVRQGIEDMSILGHEARFGMCIAENEEESPLEPLHTIYGFNEEDSTISLFWPTQRTHISGKDPAGLLDSMCTTDIFGFDLGCAFVMTTASAKLFADEGWTKKRIMDYIVEYARKPAANFNVRWVKDNNHQPEGLELPVVPTHYMRRFFSSEHLLIVVVGDSAESAAVAYGGGGDHGGPVTKKIQLPKNWDTLVKKYDNVVRDIDRY